MGNDFLPQFSVLPHSQHKKSTLQVLLFSLSQTDQSRRNRERLTGPPRTWMRKTPLPVSSSIFKLPSVRDKKYEGYSNLKGTHEQAKKRTLREQENRMAKGLEEEYILNLQKQTVLLEHEIKLLKDREVDQKNKASGYETLLRDGIPLNEHFLALKNKYNNEQDDMSKFVTQLEDEIKKNEQLNRAKQDRIEILHQEHEDTQKQMNQSDAARKLEIQRLEEGLFRQQHTRSILEAEREKLQVILSNVKQENGQLNREITRSKTYNTKADDEKARNKERKNLLLDLEELNAKILEIDVDVKRQKRKVDDRNLAKREEARTFELQRTNEKVKIDINIAESKIKELQGMREMTRKAIKDILAEKLIVEKENEGIQQKLDGKGVSDEEMKKKQIDAEAGQISKIDNNILFQEQQIKKLMAELQREETAGKEMMDAKHKLQIETQKNEEDLEELERKADANRSEIINRQVELSQLTVLEERKVEEEKTLKENNDRLIKENDKYKLENAKLEKEIAATVQRIDINNLLKHIDLEDVKLQTNNNQKMTRMINQLVNKWEKLEKDIEP